MKPRPSHLLFAAVALAALAGGVATLRFLPGMGGQQGAPASGGKVAILRAAHPAGGAILPGLRRAAAPPAAILPTTIQRPPQAPGPAPEPTPPGESEAGVEGVVSFPPLPAVPPAPPSRPADIGKAETPAPLPPVRPADLAALATPGEPPPAQDSAAPAPAAPPPAPQWSLLQTPWRQPEGAAAPAQEPPPQTAEAVPAPVYVDKPLPPSRPADLEKVAALTAQPRSEPAAAAQPAEGAPAEGVPSAAPQGQQVARLPEPSLRPAPEDAFQAPPPKFGMGDPVFVRIFKQEGQLELWLKKNGRYALYKTFPICKWSGRLGPKLKEADYQSPEGFYSVSARQLNPHSNYYRAFNVGYPNAFDRQNGRTGGLVMVHGACKSVGCFAMTDKGIEEIYGFVDAALKAGQKEVPVHIFPFRMTEHNITREVGGGWLAFVGGGGGYAQWTNFWKNLKQGHDFFEQTGEPPVAFACGDHYEFGGGSASCRRVAGW